MTEGGVATLSRALRAGASLSSSWMSVEQFGHHSDWEALLELNACGTGVTGVLEHNRLPWAVRHILLLMPELPKPTEKYKPVELPNNS